MRRTTNPQSTPHPDGRPTCYTCMRPQSHCLCDEIESVPAHCNILILQHPHERKKYYSTSKILLKALSNIRMLRGVVFDQGEIEEAIANTNAYILFPGDDALDCEQAPLDESTTVIVIDGTWSEAGKILRRNPILADLPKITFRRELRSEYKIRKQPKDHYLSTLECIGHLLMLNDGSFFDHSKPSRYAHLFEGFRKMVERQFMYFPRMSKAS